MQWQGASVTQRQSSTGEKHLSSLIYLSEKEQLGKLVDAVCIRLVTCKAVSAGIAGSDMRAAVISCADGICAASSRVICCQ
jgi:hypothetical protein